MTAGEASLCRTDVDFSECEVSLSLDKKCNCTVSFCFGPKELPPLSYCVSGALVFELCMFVTVETLATLQLADL